MSERKYALTRIAAGDYLLPSNDGETIWRIATYIDGPSMGITDWPRDRTLWGTWQYTGRNQYVDVSDWNRWRMVASTFATRRDAVDAALEGSLW